MLSPKRTKFRKAFKGRIHGDAKGGSALNFGAFGLKAMEPERITARQIEAAIRLKAPVVEFHTGKYAHAEGEEREIELRRIADAAALAAKNGIEPHAGHGLTFENVQPIAAIPQFAELNIGHYLIGEAIFIGLEESVRKMRTLMDLAR